MSINKVILVGNLGADPELKYTSEELPICTFAVATEATRRSEDGESEKETYWHTIVCFGNLAENAGKYLKKGRQVYLEGTLVPKTWEDKDGRKQTALRVHASVVEFLGSGNRTESTQLEKEDQTRTELPKQSNRAASKGSFKQHGAREMRG